MPFEPLRTDEKLDRPVKSGPDMDTVLLRGCTVFVAASLLTYGLGVWPFIVREDLFSWAGIGLAAAFGLLPVTIFGAVCARRGGLPGGAGFLGGAMALTIFLYLRFKQIGLGFEMRDVPKPEFDRSFIWMGPLGWMLWTLLVALFFVLKSPDGSALRGESDR